MLPLGLVYFCVGGMFLLLLEDRFRFWVTLGAQAVVFVLCFAAGAALLGDGGEGQRLLCVGAACALCVAASLVLYRDDALQKLVLGQICLCAYSFLELFVPLALGLTPGSAAGVTGSVFPSAACLLLYLLLGLSLFHPLRHFSDRGPSSFLVGMVLLLTLLELLITQRLDFLFRGNIPAARLLASALLFTLVVLIFRWVYHGARFRRRATMKEARGRMLSSMALDAEDRLAAIREVLSATRAGEYALDTVGVMVAQGDEEDEIGVYIAGAKAGEHSPMLETYHDDPYLNAILATKAAFAAQNEIEFSCNAVTGGAPIDMDELCLVTLELVGRGCREAAHAPGERRVRYTVLPAEDGLRLELLYTGEGRDAQKPVGSSTAAELFQRWVVQDQDSDSRQLDGLDFTRSLVSRNSGRLTVSSTGRNEVIIQAFIHY